MTSGPLSGVTVLEFSQIIAGPFAGMHLADMGANVIKFEPVEGESWRLTGELIPKESRVFASLNRGKKGVAMDMTRPEAQAAIHRLVKDADVVLINYRPGVAEQLKIDYPTLSAINPRLVYAENTAFGRKGPYSARAGYDLIVQSFTGLVAGEAKMQGAVPTYVYPAIGDYATGIQLSNSICAALYYREKTGKGQRIDVTLMGTSIAMQTSQFTWIDAFDDDILPAMIKDIHAAQAEQKPFLEQVAIHGKYRPAAAGNIYYRIFQTADGFVAVGALSHKLRLLTIGVLGITDPRFRPDGSFDLAPPNWEVDGPKLVEEVEALYLTKTTAEWGELFQAAGVPAGPVHFIEELFGHPQTQANGLEIEVDHELLGHMRLVGPPFQMSESPLAAQGPSPVLGADTDTVLAGIGYGEAEIAKLRDSGVIR